MHEGTTKLLQTLTNFLSIPQLASVEKLSTHNILEGSDNEVEHEVAELKMTSFKGEAGVRELELGASKSEVGVTQLELGVAQLALDVAQLVLGVVESPFKTNLFFKGRWLASGFLFSSKK